MSNRRKLKLRPVRLPYMTGATYVRLDRAVPGDRCEVHVGCCAGPGDLTCQGCTAPAVGVLTFCHQHETTPVRRTPYCTDHAEHVAESLRAVQLRLQGTAGRN